MKREPKMKQSEHAEWLRQIDAEFQSLGGVRFDFQEAKDFTDGSGSQPYIPGYRFQTRYGALVLHPSIPLPLSDQKPTYNCDVYGKFAELNNSERIATGLHHKWNHHYGARALVDFPIVLADICARVERLLPDVPAQAA